MQNFFPQPIPADLPNEIPNFLLTAMPTLTGGSPVTLSTATISRWLTPAKNRPDAQQKCLESALWLLAGDLDRCHRLCQDLPTPLAAAWHAAIHRQEGDFSNARYWWRRTGSLRWDLAPDTLQSLLAAAPPALPSLSPYSPSTFVDIIEKHHDNAVLLPFLLDVQRWEWAQLFLQTWADPKEKSRT